MNYINDVINIMLPETALILFVFVQIFLAMFVDIKNYKVAKWTSLLGIVIASGFCCDVQINPIYYGFNNSIISDYYTIFFKGLLLLSAFLIVLLTKKDVSNKANFAFQFHAMFLTAIVAAMVLVSSNDFLTMLVALETLSFMVIYLVAFSRGYKDKEAAFKYLMINAVSTAVLLFGVSYIYGVTGTINFTEIQQYFLKQNPTFIYAIGAIFVTCGLLFKLAVMPFAHWILDVFEGAPTSISAFIATIPKIAVLGIFARLVVFVLNYSFMLPLLIIVFALITAIWANILAIRQRNIKRLLACSSSANISYMLFALSLVSVYNLSTVLFYMLAYIIMNIGAFAAIIILENSEFTNKLYEFKNFAYSNPLFSAAFIICLIGLAGLPVTSGFISKLYLFSGILRSGLEILPLFVVLLCTIVVAGYYYLNIVRLMFEKTTGSESKILPYKTASASVILYVCAIITIILGIAPNKIIELCQIVAYNI